MEVGIARRWGLGMETLFNGMNSVLHWVYSVVTHRILTKPPISDTFLKSNPGELPTQPGNCGCGGIGRRARLRI